ncbi:hypothetical protein [Streptomyces sp. NPDC051162]|uniref:hypothetical protein n=1 Tax=Streptomyces sp. NPDC051162 TaxID=3154747 RepID=UPI00341D87F8
MKFRIIGWVAIALVLSGCGVKENSGDASKGESQINMQRGAEQADLILDQTFSFIAPSVQWTHGESDEVSCSSPNEDAVAKGTVTRRRAVMTVISPERRGSFLGIVERNWRKSGFTITGVRAHKDNPAIFATTPDDFQVSLIFGNKGQAFFEANTSCLNKSEVALPKSETNGRNYAGSEIPYPNQRSDFWSAATPVPSATPTKEGR